MGLDIWIGTWNVNGRMLKSAIGPWLFAGGKGNVISYIPSHKQTDIFVIGLQEMVDLTATTVVSESQSMKRSQAWIDAISSILNESVHFSSFLLNTQGNSYYCVASKILVGVFLCVFGKFLRSIFGRKTAHFFNKPKSFFFCFVEIFQICYNSFG